MNHKFKIITSLIVGFFCGIVTWMIQQFIKNESKRTEQTIKNMHYYANLIKEGKENN